MTSVAEGCGGRGRPTRGLSGQLATGFVERQERLAGTDDIGEVVRVLHLVLCLALEQIVILDDLMVAFAYFLRTRQACVLHALKRGDHLLRISRARLDDAVEQDLRADVRTRQAVVRILLE